MRTRTIAAALMVAAPLLALQSPQAAAFGCWGTGHGYTASTAATPVAPRRRYGTRATIILRLATMVAGLATGMWVGAVATDMALALVVLGLAA